MSKKNKKKDKDKKKRREVEPVASTQQSAALDLRSAQLPPAPKALRPAEIRELRLSLNASQGLFAQLLNVSSNAVESWEQGLREPRQATLKLLHVARKNPGALLD